MTSGLFPLEFDLLFFLICEIKVPQNHDLSSFSATSYCRSSKI